MLVPAVGERLQDMIYPTIESDDDSDGYDEAMRSNASMSGSGTVLGGTE
jgi:hypothetical protein